jgi:primosomal protein N' (replication factor Y)
MSSSTYAADGGGAPVFSLLKLDPPVRATQKALPHRRNATSPATAATDTVIRMLIRVRRDEGLALASWLRQAISVTSARHDHDAVRVQIDPLHIG